MATLARGVRMLRLANGVFSRPYRLANAKHLHTSTFLAFAEQTKGQKDDLLISESCVKQMRKLGEPNGIIRVLVEGGGCSGFQYIFELDSKPAEGDRVFEKDGIKVVIDEDSIEYVKGATIEFHEELIRSSFRIVNNPKAEQGCSCGASFALKL